MSEPTSPIPAGDGSEPRLEMRVLRPGRAGGWIPFGSAWPSIFEVLARPNVTSLVVNYTTLPPIEYRKATT